MENQFEIRPHIGFGPISLNSSQDVIRIAMANAGFQLEATHGRSDYFCESSVQVEYTNGLATFIGISSTTTFVAVYLGIDVFDVTAQEFFTQIAVADKTGAHNFDAYGYYFPGQVMTLWGADTQYDRRGNEERVVWAQIGIGSAEYAANRRRDA